MSEPVGTLEDRFSRVTAHISLAWEKFYAFRVYTSVVFWETGLN